MDWDPAKHPRRPAGSPEGGQFSVGPTGIIEFTGTRAAQKLTKKSAFELKRLAKEAGIEAGVFRHAGVSTVPGRGIQPFESFYVKRK